MDLRDEGKVEVGDEQLVVGGWGSDVGEAYIPRFYRSRLYVALI